MNAENAKTKEMGLAEVCDEFVQDMEVIGAETVAQEWPDLHILYLKIK